MPEKPKPKNDKETEAETEAEKLPEVICGIGDESSWSRDQREKNYYYDDAHGYKIYNPDDEDDEDESSRFTD